MRAVAYAYPGARTQARFGRLVTPAQWERLRRLPSPSSFLQAARDTALRAWLTQVDPAADVHEIEAQLRAVFRRRVQELAQWAPAPWRPAIEWVGVLPDLPVSAYRQRGEAELAWMRADPRLPAPAARSAGAAAPLEDWLAQWRARWPAVSRADRRALEQLLALLRTALRDARRDAPAALAALQGPLRKLFRRHARAPAGPFAWLALSWIELASVRGALLRRRLALPLEGAAA